MNTYFVDISVLFQLLIQEEPSVAVDDPVSLLFIGDGYPGDVFNGALSSDDELIKRVFKRSTVGERRTDAVLCVLNLTWF